MAFSLVNLAVQTWCVVTADARAFALLRQSDVPRGIMALFCPCASRYIVIMKFLSHPSLPTVAKFACALGILGIATGLAFASWVDKGAAIFMATVESGLAWCF